MLYVNNKYYRIYYNLMEKVCQEKRVFNSSLYEKHHILPRSLGGDNNNHNIVLLTFREHYIAHLLLTKFTLGKDRAKMCFALHTFFHFSQNKRNIIKRSVIYEKHRKMFIDAAKEINGGKNKDIKTYTFKNKFNNDIFKGTRQNFKIYSGLSDQEIYNIMSKRIRHSKGWGVYLEDYNDYSFNKKKKENKKEIKKYECPHCNKFISSTNYTRWHGDNCKLIDPEGHKKRSLQVATINKK